MRYVRYLLELLVIGLFTFAVACLAAEVATLLAPLPVDPE